MTPVILLVGRGRSGKDTAGEAIARALDGVCVALADPIKRFFMNRKTFSLTPAQLWGDQKETPITLERRGGPQVYAQDCAFALSEAVGAWKTPAELNKFPFAQWLASLPSTTTPRHLMQTFGTECVRHVDPDFWVGYAHRVSMRLLCTSDEYGRETGLVPNAGHKPYNCVCLTDGRFRNEVLGVTRRNGIALEIWRPEVQDGFSEAAKKHASETESAGIPPWWFNGRIENDGTLGQFQGKAVSMAKHLLHG